jgi:hypothetical protein
VVVEQATEQAAMASATAVISTAAGRCGATANRRGRNDTANRFGGTTAGRLAAAAFVVEQSVKQPAVAVTTAARITRRGTAARRLDRTATSGLWATAAAAEHAIEKLERVGFRRAANQHRAGANHRKDDSTTHEERSLKK